MDKSITVSCVVVSSQRSPRVVTAISSFNAKTMLAGRLAV
jgi:hypothetical protein